jgi:hypothetical protein
VIAEEASGLSQTAATLNGTVNPQGTALTECKFEYALATSSTFSAQKCETPLPTGSAGPVSAKVSGLSPFAPYKFRLFAKSANGSNTSAEETFVASSLLYPTKTTFGTEFGLSVAISGDGKTAIAGAPGGVTGGAVVYTRSSSGWSQQEVLTPSEGAGFGASAALSEDGEVAVVGAPETPESFTGGVSIFTRSGSSWTETALLNTTCAEFSCDFGSSVSISANGDTAVVGADGADGDVGAAWIFTRSGSTWTQGPKLTGGKEEVGKGYFGSAVSISGDGKTVIVGETGGEEPAAGAWVFTGSGSSWTQQGPMLKAGKDATFGESVSLSSNGSTALIGARGEGNPNVRGAAYVFTRAGSTWSDSQKITPSTQTATEEFGSSVALSAAGSIALIGASGADADGGAAYVFKHSGSKWVLEEPEEFPAGLFGYSVGLSGNGAHAIIGAPGGVGQSGSAWLF